MNQPLPTVAPRDQLDRPLRDLRISVTDRCNFRCRYCMPKEAFGPGFRFLPKSAILSFEEITRLAGAFVELGVKKLRLTGGEPLLRRELHVLIAQLAGFGCDLSLTTNGSLLEQEAPRLRAAGLGRLTVSVDSLDARTFERITDTGDSLARVLRGIEAAEACGFQRIKINTVVKRGLNDHEIVAIARHFTGRGHTVRFIEYMDVGQTNGWSARDVVSADEMLATLGRAFELTPVEAGYRGEVARRQRIAGTSAEIGFITSVSQPFCRECTRARLSASGMLYTCLFASQGTDFSGPLRAGATNDELKARIVDVWEQRTDRYSELRSATPGPRRLEMSHIGG